MPIRFDRSLRSRLALILLPSLIVLLVVSGFAQYMLAIRPMLQTFDRELGDVAIALAEQIEVSESGSVAFELSDESASLLDADAQDDVWYAVFDDRLRFLTGDMAIEWPVAPMQRGIPYFFDARIEGKPVRAVAVMTACGVMNCGVVLATTTLKRRQLVRDVQLSALLPVALLGFGALALMWFGIGRGLQPLVRLSGEIESRSPRELSAIRVEETPGEIQPLIEAVNRLMRQLAEANLAQQQFLSTAAHQLRTPLAGLQSRIELALLEIQDGASRERLAEIHESAVRSARLAVQLLSLARAEPGASTIDMMVDTDLAKLATELVDEWVPRAIARQIDLGFGIASAPVRGSPLLLREMMVNLLHNALEYTAPGGHVTLRCGQDDTGVFFSVEDDGPGIPAGMRGKVLERFVRLPGSGGSGSGLGLSIVKEIAEAHRATLDLRDVAGPHGLLVCVTFPVSHGAPEPA